MNKLILFALFVFSASTSFSQTGAWTVRRTEWTSVDEQNYSRFVQALGRSGCTNVHTCMLSSANPYRASDIGTNARFYSDCADFPYFLRAYFAWKNELPFGYVSQIRSYDAIARQNNPPPPGQVVKPFDLRYSDQGNYPVARRALVPSAKGPLNFHAEMTRLQNSIQSGMLRVGPEVEGTVPTDFYSPSLRIGSIRPGTVIYDPNGHVAVVYDVLADGRILYFDAHPDNSVTHGQFSAKFSRAKPAQGAGFKNFRPLRLEGASGSDWQGYTGGKIVLRTNAEIPDFSLVQYRGNIPDVDWKQGAFVQGIRRVTFHEYTRMVLATEKINPVVELQSSLQELCGDLKERADSVNVATSKGIHLKAHPSTLPANLFGSEGDWENFSTPGRDTRLRAAFLELKKNAGDRYNEWLRNDLSEMNYRGADLKQDYLRAFHTMNLNCPVTYKNSVGRPVSLGFELTIKRLFRLSFDPYHCPELRWGASHPEELATCADASDKRRWFESQRFARNSLSRDWSAPSAITIEMMESGRFGSAEAPEVDLRKFLQSLPPKGARP